MLTLALTQITRPAPIRALDDRFAAAAARRSLMYVRRCDVATQSSGEAAAFGREAAPQHFSARQRTTHQQHAAGPSRRRVLQLGGVVSLLASQRRAEAMPETFEKLWQGVGGGPQDLYFPEDFLGIWTTESTLTNVDLPLGAEFVPDMKVVERAKQEDLKQRIRYEVSFIRNKQGKIIIDRAFNTAKLLDVYLGRGSLPLDNITWNPNDPNRLALQLPGGTNIFTRVTRRSEETEDRKIATSEFYEQVFEAPGRIEPKVKASQCFTKYKWRSEQEAMSSGGPTIIATQVVSDYLTPYDGEALMMRANSRPVVIYTYRLAFRKAYGSMRPAEV